jgi:hypothetical protein
MLAATIAGCILLLVFWLVLTRFSRQIRTEFQKKIDVLSASLENLQTERAVAASAIAENIAKTEFVSEKPVLFPELLPPATSGSTEISAETHDAIKTMLFAAVGHEVRIHSVKLLESPEVPTTWATQGRLTVQASHNQRASRD